jgi:glycosyltransferase involved in cell wall biosynthesis
VGTLVVQIPCHNEADTLPAVLRELPRQVEGYERIRVLVIDDGCTDDTARVAERAGASVLRLGARRGLARAFALGLEEALAMGADAIVNTDGDHQYRGEDIPALVAPLRGQRCALVVGCRDIRAHREFGSLKKALQGIGSWVVRRLAGVDVPDVTSGFRALTREAALRLAVISRYTYTQETLIQAGHEGISVYWVPVKVNPARRPSRLMRSMRQYVLTSMATILRTYATYASLRAFFTLGAVFLLLGAAGIMRFVYFYIREPSYSGHVQSLLLAAAFLVLGVQTCLIGLLADLVAVNRKLIQDALYRLKREDTRTVREEARR